MIDALAGPIAVGPCRCRSGHGGCDHPLETDIVIRTGVEAWTRAFPHEYRLIGKDEAKRIVSECGGLGMWQMVFVHCPVNQENEKGNEYVICNCCACGCVPYILNRELGQRVYPLLRGDYPKDLGKARGSGLVGRLHRPRLCISHRGGIVSGGASGAGRRSASGDDLHRQGDGGAARLRRASSGGAAALCRHLCRGPPTLEEGDWRELPEKFWPVFDPSHRVRCWCLRSWRDPDFCWKRERG